MTEWQKFMKQVVEDCLTESSTGMYLEIPVRKVSKMAPLIKGFRFIVYHFARFLARFAHFIHCEPLLKIAIRLSEWEAIWTF